MTDRLEDRIRDYLANHLDMLEGGLTLVRKEYLLANPTGVGGRVDIVAKDKFGHFVIIEIKRSDDAARGTLNEVHRYTALLRINHGLDIAQVRVMVVSTDWRELLVPLSECVHSFPYVVEGFSINSDPNGTITGADRIAFIPRTAGISLSREQAGFLFQTETARDAALSSLTASVEAAGVKDFFVVRMDYTGNHPGVCYPFGLYLVFASPLPTLTPTEIAALQESIGWDYELDSPDENFLVAINRAFVGVPDDIEIGYPEKLTNIRSSWHTTICLRCGRLASPQSPWNDRELLSLAQAVEGGSSAYLYKVASPKFEAGWRRLRGDVSLVLLGMPHWVKVLSAVLDDIEATDPHATVSLALYNPANLVMSLYGLASMDGSYIPRIEIVVESQRRSEVRVVAGLLMWNGKTVTLTPEEMMCEVYGGIESWTMAVQFHETFRSEAAALQVHGLLAPVVEFRFGGGAESAPQLLDSDDSATRRTPFMPTEFLSLGEFANANATYLSSLMRLIESHVRGFAMPNEAGEA